MEYVLVKCSVNIADEYDLDGHVVMERSEFISHMKEMQSVIAEKGEVEYYRGNEIVRIEKSDLEEGSWNSFFKARPISEEFREQLKENDLLQSGTPMFYDIYDTLLER